MQVNCTRRNDSGATFKSGVNRSSNVAGASAPKRFGPAWLHKSHQQPGADPTFSLAPLSSLSAATPVDDGWHWSQISERDYSYLTGPRNYPAACAWCGGRLLHASVCDEMRQLLEPTLPFGKHKGKRLSEAPRDYLEWLSERDGMPEDLRTAIIAELARECD